LIDFTFQSFFGGRPYALHIMPAYVYFD